VLDARKARDVPCGSNSASSTRREIEEASFGYARYSQSSARAGYSRGFAVAGRLPSAAHAALARWHERRPGAQGPLRQLLRQRQERQPGWVHRVLYSAAAAVAGSRARLRAAVDASAGVSETVGQRSRPFAGSRGLPLRVCAPTKRRTRNRVCVLRPDCCARATTATAGWQLCG
jgi:hypothetical protein